ncbi:hypothetical protein [Picosynechococcus sp. PCC 73109]|uniref:hypothetical protein n=1 Tax=Picosynechococcus sp. PCC 73109 TaxID=374982 RepID=UPI0007457DB5|nr:hypothetical protein [Picosynechococcus sp. PCC 73109]AMA10690.1 hypothetical protein AWQ23_14680 [Picosynechococcus sp. PCC 73109]
MVQISFFFESNAEGGYINALSESTLVSGPIVSQNAGSTNYGIYYQVGGGGLNGAFAKGLRSQISTVNEELRLAYDAKFGDGCWAKHSNNPPSPPVLTSLLVSVQPSEEVKKECIGMMYSVGPRLTAAGLTSNEYACYTQIYRDAMNEITQSDKKISGFRITMLSSGIYRGGAPIAPFADAAASSIIDAICEAVANHPRRLEDLAILINTNTKTEFPKEVKGFSNAAKARGADFFSEKGKNGFLITL